MRVSDVDGNGADTALLWYSLFDSQYCSLVLSSKTCSKGYPHLRAGHQELLRRDQDGVIRAFNAAAGRLLGIPLHERLGKRGLGAIQLVHADGSHLDEEDFTVYKCLRSGEPILGFVFGVQRGDDVRWFETNALPFKPLGLQEVMGESTGSFPRSGTSPKRNACWTILLRKPAMIS